MAEWLPAITALIGSLVIAAGGVIAARYQRGKHRADAATSLTGSALDLADRYEEEARELRQQVRELKERVACLEQRLDSLEKENLNLRFGAERLEAQITSLGHKAVWSLKDLLVRHP